jgi:hypothetical protein
MGHALEREAERFVIEEGDLSFWYRPRVEERQPTELGDVQRLLMALAPAGGTLFRLLAMGRKRLPRAGRNRFWGFVDLVLHDPRDMTAALDAHTYGTRTLGLRHLPAARPAAVGTYALEHHDGHTHLHMSLTTVLDEDAVVRELSLEQHASYIITVMNPDPTAWGLIELPSLQYELFDEPEVHVPVPTTFPRQLQERFGGKRYAQLDTPDWLDHPGAELVFVSE